MTVTKQLLELFRVDKQLRGLRQRLETAERFLSQQQGTLAGIDKDKSTLETQAKQQRATVKNEEGEAARIDARVAQLREQMNQTKTAKEYNAFLTELNTFKEEKTAVEERMMAAMQKAEELESKLATFLSQQSDRTKIVGTAKTDRDARAAEIKDRVEELTRQREIVAAAIPVHVRKEFEVLIRQRGDEAMASVEVLDRRAHECSCSACMMAVPVESVSALMSGKLTYCPACRCILFMEDGLLESTAASKPASKKKSAAKASASS